MPRYENSRMKLISYASIVAVLAATAFATGPTATSSTTTDATADAVDPRFAKIMACKEKTTPEEVKACLKGLHFDEKLMKKLDYSKAEDINEETIIALLKANPIPEWYENIMLWSAVAAGVTLACATGYYIYSQKDKESDL